MVCSPDGRQADQHVAGRDAAPVDQPVALDAADDEAGDVVFAVGVEAGHLRGLAAEQRAAVLAARAREALDDLDGDVGVEAAGREVVEEEERLRPLHEDVVDAVIDEIDADGVVDAAHERDPQLGADAVGARDEHRIAHGRARRGGTARRTIRSPTARPA